MAWTTFITGMDPGGHGIFDFVHRNPATRMPVSSMAEITEPAHTLADRSLLLPLWPAACIHTCAPAGPSGSCSPNTACRPRVIRMPANFPPADCEAESLAGMGTPDLTGSNGTFTFFTRRPGRDPHGSFRRPDRPRRL